MPEQHTCKITISLIIHALNDFFFFGRGGVEDPFFFFFHSLIK